MSSIELTTTEDHIAVLSISRPERRNALSANTLAALHRTFDDGAVLDLLTAFAGFREGRRPKWCAL